jgi:hypothetical protein
LCFYIYSDFYLFPTLVAIAQSEQTSTYNASSSKVSIEQGISVKMTNENSVYINSLLLLLAEVKVKSDGLWPKEG